MSLSIICCKSNVGGPFKLIRDLQKLHPFRVVNKISKNTLIAFKDDNDYREFVIKVSENPDLMDRIDLDTSRNRYGEITWDTVLTKKEEVKMKKCPICKVNDLDKVEARNALSRKDNKTYICESCGQREAMEEYARWEMENDFKM
jgi:uncharacterized protein YlaI